MMWNIRANNWPEKHPINRTEFLCPLQRSVITIPPPCKTMKGGGMERKTAEVFGINALNTVQQTGRITGQGTSSIYEALATGELIAVKLGRSTRITGESIVGYIERAP